MDLIKKDKIFCLVCVIVFLAFGFAHAMAQELKIKDSLVVLNITPKESEALVRPLLEEVISKTKEKQEKSIVKTAPRKLGKQYKELFVKLLRSEGFYDNEAVFVVEGEQTKPKITFSINTGKAYKVSKVSIKSLTEGAKLPGLEDIDAKSGNRFRAQDVIKAKEQIEKYVQRENCLWKVKVEHDANVYHVSQKVEIVFILQNSPKATFGNVKFEGLDSVEEQYVKNKLDFNEGQCFKQANLEDARLTLFKTGLFSGVEIGTNEPSGGKVPVTIILTERAHRTIKAGAGFNTDEGIVLSAGWEHRNFFGNGQELEVTGKVSELFRLTKTSLTIPSFFHKKQTLTLSGEVAQEYLEAFESDSITLSGSVKRQIAKYFAVSAGSKYRLSQVDDDGVEDTFGLLSFPLSAEYDKRNDVLDPKKGFLASGVIEPFIGTIEGDTAFIRSRLNGSFYHTLSDTSYKPTFALRASTGSITGTATADIPADERFYAGGAGSVRGYPFQKLGPLDGQNDPIGGRSFVEISSETRLKFSEDWGGVFFVDGGNAYDEIIPTFSKEMKWSTGLGARYYTTFAPIRADIAIPLDKRSGIDDNFQFYISIGQAF